MGIHVWRWVFVKERRNVDTETVIGVAIEFVITIEFVVIIITAKLVFIVVFGNVSRWRDRYLRYDVTSAGSLNKNGVSASVLATEFEKRSGADLRLNGDGYLTWNDGCGCKSCNVLVMIEQMSWPDRRYKMFHNSVLNDDCLWLEGTFCRGLFNRKDKNWNAVGLKDYFRRLTTITQSLHNCIKGQLH